MKYISLTNLGTFLTKVKELIAAEVKKVSDSLKSLTLSDITDIEVTAEEVNHLDGVESNVQTQLNAKAPLASPALTGTPTAPTATKGTNTTQIATTEFVKTAVDDVKSSLGTVYTYKGSKPTFADLPLENQAGDVWNVVAKNGKNPAGTNYAWTGTEWDALGGDVDLSGYVETETLTSGYYDKSAVDGLLEDYAKTDDLDDYVQTSDLVEATKQEIEALFSE